MKNITPFLISGDDVTLREFLNAILGVIGAVSLTDAEYLLIADTALLDFKIETYAALLSVLNHRDMVSNSRDRLRFYFLARGIEVGELTYGKSNILVGGSLED